LEAQADNQYCIGKSDVCDNYSDCSDTCPYYRDKLISAKLRDNPYWQNICDIADRQRVKGVQTYGVGLEDNTWDMLIRINYLEEELVDALMYLEWIKDGIKKAEGT